MSKEGKIVKDLSDKGVVRNTLRKRTDKRKNENPLESCSNMGVSAPRQPLAPETSLCCTEAAKTATTLEGVKHGQN